MPNKKASTKIALLSLLLSSQAYTDIAKAQFNDGGSSGASTGDAGGAPGASSPGNPGMPDSESTYLSDLRKASKKGPQSKSHIAALLALGMHYNRSGRYADATRVLRQALTTMDGGAIKPTPLKDRKPERIIENTENQGTVSATVIRQPMPYEEIMEELLPQLISAEIGAGDLRNAETHVKRLINFAGSDDVRQKLNLIAAYSSYAEICKKQNRMKEAEIYKRKADEINKSFIPL